MPQYFIAIHMPLFVQTSSSRSGARAPSNGVVSLSMPIVRRSDEYKEAKYNRPELDRPSMGNIPQLLLFSSLNDGRMVETEAGVDTFTLAGRG